MNLCINNRLWEKLSDTQREAIEKASAEASAFMRQTVQDSATVNFLAFLGAVFEIDRRNALFDSILVADGLPEFSVFEIALEHTVKSAVLIGSLYSHLAIRMVTVGHTLANFGPLLDGIEARKGAVCVKFSYRIERHRRRILRYSDRAEHT